MRTNYYHLRKEKTRGFNAEDFIKKIEGIPFFRDQLDFFDEYFDVLKMGRIVYVESDYTVAYALFNTHVDEYYNDGSPSEIGKILTEWRLERLKPLKWRFDQLSTYKERIDFSIEHFNIAACCLKPEGIDFSTLPTTKDEWLVFNLLTYEIFENSWIEAQLRMHEKKTFALRKS